MSHGGREKTSPAVQLQSVAVRYRLQHWSPHWARAAGEEAGGPGPSADLAGELPPVGDERLARLEAVLLVSREPLPTRKLSQLANLADGTEARTLIRQLNARYDQVGRAFRVEEVAGGYQLLTRPQFAPWLRRLTHVPREVRLSPPALETLAVVAYRQPALKAEIEAIRGVNCGEILRQLMDRDLVRIGGRSEELGRPYLYATTRRFLQLFGLRRLEELPRGGTLTEWTAALETAQDAARDKPHDPAGAGSEEIPADHTSLEEDLNVSVTLAAELQQETLEDKARRRWAVTPRAVDDDVEEEEDEVDDEDDLDDDEDEDEEDFDDEDDDFDDDLDEEEDEEDDEEEEEEEEEDLEEAEWEEVDDEDEEEEEEDDEEDDDDWDDEDEEEEEDLEEEV